MGRSASHYDRLEQATRVRLARLAQHPVPVHRLERWLQAMLVPATPVQPRATPRWPWGWSLGLAAAVAVAAALALFAPPPATSPAVASSAALAQLHQDVRDRRIELLPAATVQQAQQHLALHLEGPVQFPQLGRGEVVGSCLEHHAGQPLPSLAVRYQDQLLTVTVAETRRVAPPPGEIYRYRGRVYCLHQVDQVRIVVRQEADRWVCVTGTLPTETLVVFADELRWPAGNAG